MSVYSFATADDVAAGYRTLTAGESELAEVLCGRASDKLAMLLGSKLDQDDALLMANLLTVTCDMVRRALDDYGELFGTSGNDAQLMLSQMPAGALQPTRSEMRLLSRQRIGGMAI